MKNVNIENMDTNIQNENSEIEGTSKRKRNKKKLLLMFLLLLVTGIILGTSTYAWFLANKTVAVNDITVNVAAQNGIQVSVDGTSWKSIIQTADILGATANYEDAVNQVPTTTNSISPVSTVGNIDANGMMEMYAGSIETDTGSGNYILTALKSTETAAATSGNFIAFDLFFKVDSTVPVYLTPNSGVTTADANDNGIKNASRMGFVILGNTTNGDSLENIQALNAGTSAVKYIWEPNYDVHTASGVANAHDYYGLTTTLAGGPALAYSGVKAPIATANTVLVRALSPATHAVTYPDYFGAVTPDYKTTSAFAANYPIFTLTAGITKVRLYMWVEGQDVDCETGASGGNITYGLQITTLAA